MNYTDIIKDKPKAVISISDQLRKLTEKLHPELEEDCYGGKAVQMALYSIGKKDNVFFGIAPSKDHCKLFFHHFDKIDLKGLKLTGKGKHARHIKFFEGDEIPEIALKNIFQELVKIGLTKK